LVTIVAASSRCSGLGGPAWPNRLQNKKLNSFQRAQNSSICS
jgi:hypothetical protein